MMQNFEKQNIKIREAFKKLKAGQPEKLSKRLNLSWSNWGFGMEPLEDSLKRLNNNKIQYIELHGNHYGSDLGYKPDETKQLLKKYNMKISGVCGMFSPENDLSSNIPQKRQAAIDYIKRELEFAKAVDAGYLLVVPGAVGRPNAYDDAEFERSVETLRIVAPLFAENNIRAAVEPIRSAEVSLVHTIADAKKYINAVNHPGIRYINGDTYHMQTEEVHIGNAIMDAGSMLTNLHIADSNRCALGLGSLDLDIIIMALYLLGYNTEGKYVTPEPLGPGGDPYPAMNSIPDQNLLDEMVAQTANYFREREEEVIS